MNDSFVRRARKLSVAGTGAILFGLAVSACTPVAAPAPGPTAPAPSASTAPATQSAPAPSSPAAPATVAPAADKAAPAHQEVPTLGVVWGQHQRGYGTARPGVVDNGGDGSGVISDVHWRTWGGKTAVGSGTATFVRDGEAQAQGLPKTATIEAWDLGPCHGKLVYRTVDWYFPQEGGTVNEHGNYNICTGEAVDR